MVILEKSLKKDEKKLFSMMLEKLSFQIVNFGENWQNKEKKNI